jgi:hypothetical protein
MATAAGVDIGNAAAKSVWAPPAVAPVSGAVWLKGASGAFSAATSTGPPAVVMVVVLKGNVGVGNILWLKGVGVGVTKTPLAACPGSPEVIGKVFVGPVVVPVKGVANGSTKGVPKGVANGSVVGVAKEAKGSVTGWVVVNEVAPVRIVVGVKGMVGVKSGVGVGVGCAEMPRP